MCLPAVPAELTPRNDAPTPAELTELGTHLVRERPIVEQALARTLPRRLRARFTTDLIEEVASAWVVEMYYRLTIRSAEHRALPVLTWARLVWRYALSSAVRDVDCRQSGPVLLPYHNIDRRAVPASRPCEPTDAVDLPTPIDRAARVAMMLRPAEVAILAEEPTGEHWRKRTQRQAAARAELLRVIEGEL
jgi:hypothetical protein